MTALLVFHVFVAFVLVVVVLLQSGKGGGLGAGLGGGSSNTLFGASGGSNFFTKLTAVLAALFMLTSLTLTVKKGRKDKTSVFDENKPVQTAPVNPGAAPVPGTQPGANAPQAAVPAANAPAANAPSAPAAQTAAPAPAPKK